MARLIVAVFFIAILAIGQGWRYSTVDDHQLPVTVVRASVQGDVNSPSLFNEIDRIMASMHQRFSNMFRSPSFYMPTGDIEEYSDMEDEKPTVPTEVTDLQKVKTDILDIETDIKNRFAAIEPVCTTIIDAPAAISQRKSRRKKPRTTQTKTCIKEFILNGQKHLLEDVTVTDDKGLLVKQYKTHSTITLETVENKVTFEPTN